MKLRRSLVAEAEESDAEVVGRRRPPGLRAVIIVVTGPAGVAALHLRTRLVGRAARARADAADAVRLGGRNEDIDPPRVLAQNVIGAPADEDARLAFGHVAYHVALDLEQRVVRQHAGHPAAVAREGRAQVADHGRKHAARLLLVGLLEELGAQAALPGRQRQQLLVVEPDAQPPGDDLPDVLAAAAQLAAYVDYE